MDMMEFPPPRRKRRPVFGINLTPLIDVFSIIVIFLIKGTVFQQANAGSYADVKVPLSKSKENLDDAMKVIIVQDKLQIPSWNEEFPLDVAKSENALHPMRIKFNNRMKQHFASLKERDAAEIPSVQLIAGRDRSYDVIYAVSEMLQSSGAAQVVFVTEGW